MQTTVEKMVVVRQDYLKYSFLWTDDMNAFLKRFAKGEFLQPKLFAAGCRPVPLRSAMFCFTRPLVLSLVS